MYCLLEDHSLNARQNKDLTIKPFPSFRFLRIIPLYEASKVINIRIFLMPHFLAFYLKLILLSIDFSLSCLPPFHLLQENTFCEALYRSVIFKLPVSTHFLKMKWNRTKNNRLPHIVRKCCFMKLLFQMW